MILERSTLSRSISFRLVPSRFWWCSVWSKRIRSCCGLRSREAIDNLFSDRIRCWRDRFGPFLLDKTKEVHASLIVDQERMTVQQPKEIFHCVYKHRSVFQRFFQRRWTGHVTLNSLRVETSSRTFPDLRIIQVLLLKEGVSMTLGGMGAKMVKTRSTKRLAHDLQCGSRSSGALYFYSSLSSERWDIIIVWT